jgi:hypothetical protein
MGYYIEVPVNRQKAEIIAHLYDGKIVSELEAANAMLDSTKGVICVVENRGMGFEAAGFCYNMAEFEAFTDSGDPRTKQFVVIPRELAKKYSGYRGE